MEATKYEGDVEAYIDQMETLNLRLGLVGIPWKETLKKGLSPKLLNRLSLIGADRKDDEEFVEAVRTVGIRYEERLEEQGLKAPSAGEDKPKSKKKRRKERGTNSDPLKPQNSTDRVTKQKGEGKKPFSGKKPQKKLHESREAALKGLNPNQIEKRQKDGVCLRCGKGGHRWFQCQGEVVTVSAKKTAGQKRRIPEEAIKDEEETAVAKRPKVAARGVAHGISREIRGRGINANATWKERIFEIDSEEEVD